MSNKPNNGNFRLRLKNIHQLVQISNTKAKYKCGKKDMNDLCILTNAGMIIDHDGKIYDINKEDIIANKYHNATFDQVIDCSNKTIIPGLCDGHTHPVWSGDRVHEFQMKLQGKTYMEIHAKGGGINFTVNHVKNSTEQELLDLFIPRLNRMLKQGTTLIEGKSGYGLDYQNELKMLRVLSLANQQHPIDIVANYCAGHAIPKGLTEEEHVNDIINHQIPQLKQDIDRQYITNCKLIDVFCEKGVISTNNAKKILLAGQSINLLANFHGDELSNTNSATMGANINSLAISHLEHITDQGIIDMCKHKTIAVLLPTTAYILRIDYPPARKLIDSNVIVSLATDYNPNAHCLSLPFVMHLACVNMYMTLEEALVACTLNSAASINQSHTNGSLEIGKNADFIILNATSWTHLIYQLIDPPIESVYKNGIQVV